MSITPPKPSDKLFRQADFTEILKKPEWRQELYDILDKTLKVKDKTYSYIYRDKETTQLIKALYVLLCNEIADIRKDLTNIHDSILEINRQMGINYNPESL